MGLVVTKKTGSYCKLVNNCSHSVDAAMSELDSVSSLIEEQGGALKAFLYAGLALPRVLLNTEVHPGSLWGSDAHQVI